MEFTVESAAIFKQGQGAKGPWTLYKLKLVGDPQEPTGFDPVAYGDKVTLQQSPTTGKDGKQYTNLNYTKSAGSVAAAPAQAALGQQYQAQAPAAAPQAAAPVGADPRVLKMLVKIADHIGIDRNETLDILG